MSNVVRPDFRRGQSETPEGVVRSTNEALSFCGLAGFYRVALFQKEYPTAVLKVVIMRYDSETMYPVATLPATKEGRIEAHTVANAVLESLRISNIFCDYTI